MSLQLLLCSPAVRQEKKNVAALTAHQIHRKNGLILGSQAQACNDTHRPSSWCLGEQDIDSLPEGLSKILRPTDPFLGGLCQVASCVKMDNLHHREVNRCQSFPVTSVPANAFAF